MTGSYSWMHITDTFQTNYKVPETLSCLCVNNLKQLQCLPRYLWLCVCLHWNQLSQKAMELKGSEAGACKCFQWINTTELICWFRPSSVFAQYFFFLFCETRCWHPWLQFQVRPAVWPAAVWEAYVWLYWWVIVVKAVTAWLVLFSLPESVFLSVIMAKCAPQDTYLSRNYHKGGLKHLAGVYVCLCAFVCGQLFSCLAVQEKPKKLNRCLIVVLMQGEGWVCKRSELTDPNIFPV